MQELLLINPAKRSRRKSRKTASPAQRRARAAFAARARAKNPARRRRAARVHSLPAVRRRRNPIVARRRSMRRRNPVGGFAGTAIDMVKDAAIGGAGALGVDIIAGQIKPMLPVSMQTGNSYAAAKALITVGVGVFGRRVLGNVAMQAARGALTVQAYNLFRPYVPATMQLGSLSPSYVMPGARSGKPAVAINAPGGMHALRRVGGMGALSPNGGTLRALETNGHDFLRAR